MNLVLKIISLLIISLSLLKGQDEFIEKYIIQFQEYAQNGDYENALLYLNKVYEIDSKIPGIEYKLGTLYLMNNQLSKAKSYLFNALEYDTTNNSVYYNLACISFRENEDDMGFIYLEKSFRWGYTNYEWLWKDTDLERIRQDKKFSSLISDYFSREDLKAIDVYDSAMEYYDNENYRKAAKLFLKAIKIENKTENISPVFIYNCYGYAGYSFGGQKKYKKSIEALKKGIKYSKKYGWKEKMAVDLSLIGYHYGHLNKYDESINYHEKAIILGKEIWDSLDVANEYRAISNIYLHELGDDDKGIDYIFKELNIYDELDDSINSAQSAGMLSVIGNRYFNKGDYINAKKCLEKSITYNFNSDNLELFALSMQNLAICYLRTGEIEESLLISENVMQIAYTHNLDYFIFSTPLAIGFPLIAVGKYEEGLEMMLRSLDFLNSYENPELADTLLYAEFMVNVFIGMGYYASTGKFETAVPYYNTALSIVDNVGLEKDAFYYYIKAQKVIFDKNDVKNHLTLLKKAVNHPSALETYVGFYAQLLSDLGLAYYFNQNTEKAYEYFNKAYDYSSSLNDPLGKISALRGISITSMADGILKNNRESIEISERSLSELLAIHETVYLKGQKFSKQILDQSLVWYEWYAMVLFMNNKDIKALAVLDDIKSRSLRNKLLKTKHEKPIYGNKDLVLTDSQLLIGLDMINNASHGLYREDTLVNNSLLRSMNMNFLEINEKDYDLFVQTFETSDSIFWNFKTKEDVLFSENMPNLSVIVKMYNNYLKSRDPRSKELSKSLYKYLIESDHIIKDTDKSHLIIIPDPLLSYLPFETLIDENGNYLIESYDISYIQSRDIYSIIQSREYDDINSGVLAFGGVVYSGLSNHHLISANIELVDLEKIVESKMETRATLTDIYSYLGYSEIPYLPFTLPEVKEIEKLIPESSIVTGMDASEYHLKRMSERGELSQYSVLHFATHGIVVPELPNLSAIIFAPSEDHEEDGFLNTHEIMNLNLKADFVNLSACETGLGKIYKGEGVVGLTQAFLIAGANSISVTLWPVADVSTSLFMQEMYRFVEESDMSYLQAITKVKREFISGRYGEEYKKPYYWAPFVYYGK